MKQKSRAKFRKFLGHKTGGSEETSQKTNSIFFSPPPSSVRSPPKKEVAHNSFLRKPQNLFKWRQKTWIHVRFFLLLFCFVSYWPQSWRDKNWILFCGGGAQAACLLQVCIISLFCHITEWNINLPFNQTKVFFNWGTETIYQKMEDFEEALDGWRSEEEHPNDRGLQRQVKNEAYNVRFCWEAIKNLVTDTRLPTSAFPLWLPVTCVPGYPGAWPFSQKTVPFFLRRFFYNKRR